MVSLKKFYFNIINKLLLVRLNLFTGLFWSIVVAIVIYGNLPSQWTNISNEVWLAIHSVAPQHWFFTDRDVHRPQITIYQVNSNGSLILSEIRPMSAEYKFGLNRQNRIKQAAFTQIVESFPNQNWTTVDIDYDRPPLVDINTFQFMKYSHPSRFPSSCGRFILKRQAPPEYSQLSEKTELRQPATILGIEILCT